MGDPQYSARSLFKLIRWARYFENAYKPKKTSACHNDCIYCKFYLSEFCLKPKTVSFKDLKTETEKNLVKLERNNEKCYICKIDDLCCYTEGNYYCRDCLWRRSHFVNGILLRCKKCKSKLDSIITSIG